MTVDFTETIALVTGGQRGLGAAFTDELLARGAKRVYVTARDPQPAQDRRIYPIALDVTDLAQVDRLPTLVPDATLVINNAGFSVPTPLLSTSWDDIITHFDINTIGPLRVALAMAPVLAESPHSQLVNIHSVLSWIAGSGAYGASKAGLWALTNQLRLELAAQHTTVTGVHLGLAETDMTKDLPGPKLAPAEVAKRVLDGVATGEPEVLVDEVSAGVKAMLSGPVEKLVLSL